MTTQPSPQPTRHLVFGPFVFDEGSGDLLKHGVRVRLEGQPLQILTALIGKPGQAVSREELHQLLWKDGTFVDFDHGLNAAINRLRQTLGDSAERPRYIETLAGRGYRFVCTVQDASLKPDPSVPLVATVASEVEPTPIDSPLEPAAAAVRGPRSIWTWAAIVATAVAVLAVYTVYRTRNANRLGYRVDSLVVLPFVNLTADPEDEYFCDGLTEELTNAAAHLDGLRVVARTTAFQFKGKAQDIRSIAQQLHVGTVLEGSVRRQEKKLRVTVQLNDSQSGYHIWSQTYDREVGDSFRIQGDISTQVAHAIRPDDRSVRVASTIEDREAYNLYLMGRFHRSKPDQASVRKAIAFFEQAIAKDPRYAAAYAGLAECFMKLAQQNSMPPMEAWAVAQKAAGKALALDDNLAEAHTTQAIVCLLMDRNWEAAEREFRRAIALNGNDAAAHHWFSHYFMAMGQLSESLTESRTALALDPLDIQISSHLIFHYIRARDFSNAIQAGLRTLELDPHSRLAYLFLGWAYEDTEQWDKAIDALQRASEVRPDETALRAAVKSEGPRGYWRTNLEFLLKQHDPDNYRLAIHYARLGDLDNALTRLDRAFQRHEPELIYVKREPAFDSMQGNPGFMALTDRMRLP